MNNKGKQQSIDDTQGEHMKEEDRINQSDCGDSSGDSSTDADNASFVRISTVPGSIVEDEGGYMMLQSNWREENVLKWIQALDVQVMGACRSDERLKPLLKLNACTGAAEDRLLMHLSQNFEPSEVGMLARCLCAPLVSLRVGKIDKQGTLLCPTSTRGNLNLTLLPSSGLRISFVGDDGFTERMATLNTDAQCHAVEIEELKADRSGQSFALRIPDHDILYFWCSEKRVLSGIELLRKMGDLLKCKPCLSEVTGISKSRLDAFGVHLRAYLIGPATQPPLSASGESIEFGPIVNVQSSVHSTNHGTMLGSLSLSPRSSSFEESESKNTSLKGVSIEMFRRRGERESYVSCIDSTVSITTSSGSITNLSGSYNSKDELLETAGNFLFPHEKDLTTTTTDTPLSSPAVQIPSEALPLLSPYYCWCPPTSSSSVQQNGGGTTTTVPPSERLLSSLLSNNLTSGISKLNLPRNLLDLTTTTTTSKLPPPFLPDGFPLSFQKSNKVPTFTSLMCDPIVHIPVMNFCSSGEGGYLVSAAGPTALSTAIAPVRPNIVGHHHHHHHHPLMPETDSAVEKGARETLRLLISRSNELNPPLMDLLPPVLTIRDEKQNILAVGSRGLYIGGTRDIAPDAATKIKTDIGSASSSLSSSETCGGGGEIKRCSSSSREKTVSGGLAGGGTISGNIGGGGDSCSRTD